MADVRTFLRHLFGRLIRRPAPWRRDRSLPQVSVFLTGEGDLEPLIVPDGQPVPYFSPAVYSGVPDLVKQAVAKLGERTGPRGLPRIRFQLTGFVLLVLRRRELGEVAIPDMERALAEDRPGRGGPPDDRPRVVMLDYLGRSLTGWIPAASVIGTWLGQATTLLAWGVSVAAGVVVAVGHAAVLARTHVRSSWFRKQAAQQRTPWERLPAYASRLAARASDEELERLLVGAFLEDLRQAYRRRRLFLWPAWARAYHCVLYLKGVTAADTAAAAFLGRLHEVRERNAQWDPLLVVTSGPESPGLVRDVRTVRVTGADGDEEAHHEWLRRVSHRHGPAYLVIEGVDLTAGDDRRAAPLAPVAGHKRVRAYWTIMVALLVVPLIASGLYVWNSAMTYCQAPDVLRDELGECVGISDGGYVFHDRLKTPIARIAAENVKAVDSGRYVEIVYIGPMTGAPDALLAGSHGELYGIAAYQQDYNAQSGDRPKMRVLLGNPGKAFRKSVTLARQVVDRLESGAPIVGVIGMAQSRAVNQEAIAVLNTAGLPVMVTVGTADELGQHERVPSPYFFRMAANNGREARASAAWVRAGTGGLPAAKKVTLLEDVTEGDLYSADLAAGFRDAFGEAGVTSLSYTGGRQLKAQVKKACAGKPDLIYYTGRGDDFVTFVQGVDEGCSQSRIHHVLASDDVTKYVQDNHQRLKDHPNLRLHYVTLAWEKVWDHVTGGEGQGGKAQIGRIQRLIGKDAQPSRLHAMLAHDAALALGLAIAAAPGPVPDKGTVLFGLSTMGTQYGTTGVIEFTGGRELHESAGKPVMLIQVGQEPKLVGVCGRLTEVGPSLADCPDRALRGADDANGPPVGPAGRQGGRQMVPATSAAPGTSLSGRDAGPM
ncbi:ABC transporter substrate-binding protein [Nonomuraea sp. ATR24]|uniref:ABC transporter substrate-binding protein n=1 Tax=Nonomuraea TaxID=83681 RepID=UPI001C5EA496|nr:ABC transporter substrate-binding protein [Nonomuraea ceibae]